METLVWLSKISGNNIQKIIQPSLFLPTLPMSPSTTISYPCPLFLYLLDKVSVNHLHMGISWPLMHGQLKTYQKPHSWRKLSTPPSVAINCHITSNGWDLGEPCRVQNMRLTDVCCSGKHNYGELIILTKSHNAGVVWKDTAFVLSLSIRNTMDKNHLRVKRW